MIKIVALDETLVDLLVDVVADHRRDVESGATSYGDSVDNAEALHEMDEILAALRNAEDSPTSRQINVAGDNTGAITL